MQIEKYQKGMLKVVTPLLNRDAYLPLGTAFLPHSCDEWVIGGPEEIKMLIEDLQEVLRKVDQ